MPGAELDGVLYLRSVDDSDALRARLDAGGSVVVVGAGWIGCEVAASARQRGLEVTVIDPLGVPLERVLGPELGAVYRDVHTDNGVRMLMETGVEAFEGDGRVERVRTSDGGRARLRLRRGGRGGGAADAAGRRGRASPFATAWPSTPTSAPSARTCSPPATWRAPSIPSTGSRSAWSTGRTR